MELDIEKIVDIVTNEIMRRLGDTAPEALVTDGCPDDLVSENYSRVRGSDVGSCKYVVLTAEAYKALICREEAPKQARPEKNEEPSSCCCCRSDVVDLRGKRLLHERDLRENNALRGTVVKISKRTIVTALANDYAKGQGVKIVRED